jgi:hypothetical protein
MASKTSTKAIDKRLHTLSPLNNPPSRGILQRFVFFLFNLYLKYLIPASKPPRKRRINIPALVKAHSTVNIDRRTDLNILSITAKEIPAKSFEADWIEPAVFRNRYVLYLTGMKPVLIPSRWGIRPLEQIRYASPDQGDLRQL